MGYKEEFETIWAMYPRKIARATALRAYTARRKEGMGYDEAWQAVRLYARDREGEDEKFTMHCSSFFGKHRRGWEDYRVAEKSRPSHYRGVW